MSAESIERRDESGRASAAVLVATLLSAAPELLRARGYEPEGKPRTRGHRVPVWVGRTPTSWAAAVPVVSTDFIPILYQVVGLTAAQWRMEPGGPRTVPELVILMLPTAPVKVRLVCEPRRPRFEVVRVPGVRPGYPPPPCFRVRFSLTVFSGSGRSVQAERP